MLPCISKHVFHHVYTPYVQYSGHIEQFSPQFLCPVIVGLHRSFDWLTLLCLATAASSLLPNSTFPLLPPSLRSL